MGQSPPHAEEDWRRVEETLDRMSTRGQDARSGMRFGREPMESSTHDHAPGNIKQRQFARHRRSIGGRVFRFVTRFSIAVLIGVGATLGWQSYGDAARAMLVARAPTLAWLLSDPTVRSPTAAATAVDPMQLLTPLASNLDLLRRSVDLLAAKQDQMAQRMAALQAAEEDVRQKLSLTLSSSALAPQVATIPQQRPTQPKAQPPAVQSASVPRPTPAAPVVPAR
jgi:hypothetical protein